ncbi:MAG: helix-hairpin-helix domain-containing protein [Bacteroidetes bacterium]|nr:helix-hairpin-helix domain-containing protein [Bacteroidota bacterium]
MKQFLKDYFTFNKGDRNGILVLLFLILALLFTLSILNALIPTKKVDFVTFDNILKELEAADKGNALFSDTVLQSSQVKNSGNFNSGISHSKPEPHLFPFNPNTQSPESWKELGLSPKQITTITHYQEKGGKFFKKEDLKKIYGISESLYLQLEPFIQLPEKEKRDNFESNWDKQKGDTLNKRQTFAQKQETPQQVELNSADTAELKAIKGIGSAFAKRILNYREKLGGFLSFKQLYEVWGVDTETVSKIIPQLTLNTAMVRKIPINHCNVSDLKKHPYLNYNIANNIVLYRDRHGDFTKLQDIRQAVLVNEELFRKIAPYLTLD